MKEAKYLTECSIKFEYRFLTFLFNQVLTGRLHFKGKLQLRLGAYLDKSYY